MTTPKNEVRQASKPAFWYRVADGKLHRNAVEGETPSGKNDKGYEYVVARAVHGKITGVGLDEKQHNTGPFYVVTLKVETEEETSFVEVNFSGGGYSKNLMARLLSVKAADKFGQDFTVAPYQMQFTPEGETE